MDGTIRTGSFRIERAAYLKAMWSRGLWKRLGIIAAIYAVVIAALYATLGLPAVIGGAPTAVVVLALIPPVRYFVNRRVVYGRSGASVFDDPRTMEFSVDGFHIRTDGGVESTVPWSHVERAEWRGGFDLLFTSRLQHFIVPDSAFASASDREAFQILLRGRGLVKA